MKDADYDKILITISDLENETFEEKIIFQKTIHLRFPEDFKIMPASMNKLIDMEVVQDKNDPNIYFYHWTITN